MYAHCSVCGLVLGRRSHGNLADVQRAFSDLRVNALETIAYCGYSHTPVWPRAHVNGFPAPKHVPLYRHRPAQGHAQGNGDVASSHLPAARAPTPKPAMANGDARNGASDQSEGVDARPDKRY
jgi:hypothetical protein